MSDYDDFKHKRRPFVWGVDRLPVSSTVQLMLHVPHAMLASTTCNTQAKQSAANKSGTVRREAAKRRHLSYSPCIRYLLTRCVCNSGIAALLQLTVRSVRHYIEQSEELKELSRARPGYGPTAKTRRRQESVQ